MKAKDVSLAAIVLSVVWVALLFLVKGFVPVIWTGKAFGLDAKEIIISGAFFVVACSPVYRSIWMDKKLGLSTEKLEKVEAEKLPEIPTEEAVE